MGLHHLVDLVDGAHLVRVVASDRGRLGRLGLGLGLALGLAYRNPKPKPKPNLGRPALEVAQRRLLHRVEACEM